MKLSPLRRAFSNQLPQVFLAIVCLTWLSANWSALRAQQPTSQAPPNAAAAADTTEAPKIPNDQLDSLVAPIALYPDPLLSQTLVAATYPVELIQLQQWMGKNPGLKDQALADAIAKQPWDASIQGLAAFPDVVERLAGNIQWASDLGNAFLAQQNDVMAAVQRMRAKAQGTGTLTTSAQQKVETQTTSTGQQAIVIQPADPKVVYVPSYDPAVVYGASSTYPYPQTGYVAGTALAWGAGLALGAAWGGSWGYGCGWNNGDVTINNNNNYVKNSNINNPNRGQGNSWQHNPQHRGNAPYGNKQTAGKYGGTARGETRPAGGAGANAGNRPAGAAGGAGAQGNRPGGAGAGAAAKPGGGAGAGSKPGGGPGAGAGAKTSGGAGAGPKAGGGGGAAAKSSGGGAGAGPKSGGGANKVGSHQVSSGGGGGAFGGGGGSSAKAASSRGGASMGGGGKGGGGRGGGGGGGGRGGGGGGGRKR